MGDAKRWGSKKITAAQARAAGATFNDIVWAASALAPSDKDIERRLRLWMADCAAHVLHVFEKERATDIRPREAIIVARQFAQGDVLAAARDAAWAAAVDAAVDAARAAARDAARAAEQDWQFDRLVLWLSENEPSDWPLPDQVKQTEAA
jgi:hypothetical protein